MNSDQRGTYPRMKTINENGKLRKYDQYIGVFISATMANKYPMLYSNIYKLVLQEEFNHSNTTFKFN